MGYINQYFFLPSVLKIYQRMTGIKNLKQVSTGILAQHLTKAAAATMHW